MTANEILVLTSIAASGSHAVPALNDLAQATGLSLSQCFDAIEGLAEAQTLDPSRKFIRVDALEHLYLYALPFLVPGRILGMGHGLCLTLSDVSTTDAISPTTSAVWVWPSQWANSKGLQISPLHPHLEQLLEWHPEWQDFFSCVEILRFRDHSLRSKAEERVRFLCNKIREQQTKRAETYSEEKNQSAERLIEAASKVISETGFRNINFDELAKKIGSSREELEKFFGNVSGLADEIGKACAARASVHFVPMLLAKPEDRLREAQQSLANFFQYLEVNEDYFRLGAWFYVERMFEAVKEGALTESFFEKIEAFFEQIPSKRTARARAVCFANSWVSYAWFRWFEYPKMSKRDEADARLKDFRDTLIECLC